MPTVSVVIPTYKASPFIRETLASVFAQTRLPDEVIVVDDCSPDDTVAVVEEIAKTAPVPVRVIRLEKNSGGPAKPIETGIQACKGELIAVLDQDDVFITSKIEQQAAVLEDHPELSFVFAKCSLFDTPQVSLQHDSLIQHVTAGGCFESGCWLIPGAHLLALLIAHGNFVVGFPGFMFRKQSKELKGSLDTTLFIAADYELLCRLCVGVTAFVNEIHYLRREHDTNICRRRHEMLHEMEIVRRQWRLDKRFRMLGPYAGYLRREYSDLAYEQRTAGQFGMAIGWIWASLVLWGPRLSILSALLKTCVHFARDRLTLFRSLRRLPSQHGGT